MSIRSALIVGGSAAAAVVLVGRAWPVAAQGLPCPEFRVNEQNRLPPGEARVASTPSGDFVVVWQDLGGRARLYDAAGTPRGPEFRLDSMSGAPYNPDVALDAAGNGIAVWDTNGIGANVFARRFDAAGSFQGPEFIVNTDTDYEQQFPSVATGPGGNFVVVWASYAGGLWDVSGQRYDDAGHAQGTEFRVNTSTAGIQTAPAVSVDPTGAFVVVWMSDWAAVMGQRFDASGLPLGREEKISSNGSGVHPRVAHGRRGDFLVVWSAHSAEDGGYRILARRFDSAGNSQGPAVQVNTFTAGPQSLPSVAADSNGGYVVVWTSQRAADALDVMGRRLDPSAVPMGEEFRLNSDPTGDQRRPAVAAGANGGFVAVWESGRQRVGIFGNLDCARLAFYTVTPCRVADTRDPSGPAGGPSLEANATRSFPVSGRCGIPAEARAVAVNVTAVNPTDGGDLRLYPAGQPAPLASTLNFRAGQTRAGSGIAWLGADGRLTVQCDMPPGSTGLTDVVLDVAGYFRR